MNWNTLFFVILPYVALFIAIIVTIYRGIYRPFSISSLSSQLLERRRLFWGSIPFHWGIIIILTGHLVALLVPRSIVLWNAHPLRLYLLELTGVGLGLWALIGLLVLSWRRMTVDRIRVISTPMDFVVLALLLISVVTGLITATYYRWGSYWFTGIFTPYIWGILTFRPDAAPLAPLPFTIKLHVFNFYLLTLAFAFSRLVHIITWPVGYLIRPWQIVIANRGLPVLNEEEASQ
ncbi:MAG: Respiratory nitrate reductase 1 gamma chain [Chloroflexi bacterium ADurb.Bin325]|nr:MAG: Respiratory nitrate reductase 1 gamma chain [Chloroflexi bacterium ADurb.Bin325]